MTELNSFVRVEDEVEEEDLSATSEGGLEEGSEESDSESGSSGSGEDDNGDDEPVLKYRRFAKEAVTSIGDQVMNELKPFICSITVHSKVSTILDAL